MEIPCLCFTHENFFQIYFYFFVFLAYWAPNFKNINVYWTQKVAHLLLKYLYLLLGVSFTIAFFLKHKKVSEISKGIQFLISFKKFQAKFFSNWKIPSTFMSNNLRCVSQKILKTLIYEAKDWDVTLTIIFVIFWFSTENSNLGSNYYQIFSTSTYISFYIYEKMKQINTSPSY